MSSEPFAVFIFFFKLIVTCVKLNMLNFYLVNYKGRYWPPFYLFLLPSLFSISTGQFKTRQIRNNFEINMLIKKSIYSTFYVFNYLSNSKRDETVCKCRKKNRGQKEKKWFHELLAMIVNIDIVRMSFMWKCLTTENRKTCDN